MLSSLSPFQSWSRLGKLGRRKALACYLFLAPWFLGFLLWQLGPMLASLWLSLTRYSIAKAPVWIGVRNYVEIYNDDLFWQSLKVTLLYLEDPALWGSVHTRLMNSISDQLADLVAPDFYVDIQQHVTILTPDNELIRHIIPECLCGGAEEVIRSSGGDCRYHPIHAN